MWSSDREKLRLRLRQFETAQEPACRASFTEPAMNAAFRAGTNVREVLLLTRSAQGTTPEMEV